MAVMRKKRPTQFDVAQLAGVSQAMVSYVLNDNPNISVPNETRQRVLDAMDELGYVPNRAAQMLRTQRTNTIACVVPDITNAFHTQFARGLQSVAEQYEYDLVLYNTDRVPAKESKFLQRLQEGRVDGVIMTALHSTPEDFLPLLEMNIPVVIQGPNVMPTQVNGLPLDSLFVDDVAASATAVSFLLEKNHTRIGMIAGEVGTPPRQRREQGYRQTLAAHDIAIDEELIRGGGFREEGGYQSMHNLLNLAQPPTAVFAASDVMAIGAMMAIRDAGLEVPGDIALVGFDDIPIAKLISPPLTTIAQFEGKLGQRAAEMLFDRLHDQVSDVGRREEMPYQLIVRASA
jgi:LacI family transcriptional regulator